MIRIGRGGVHSVQLQCPYGASFCDSLRWFDALRCPSKMLQELQGQELQGPELQGLHWLELQGLQELQELQGLRERCRTPSMLMTCAPCAWRHGGGDGRRCWRGSMCGASAALAPERLWTCGWLLRFDICLMRSKRQHKRCASRLRLPGGQVSS